jgi:hypothetical protein
LLLFTDPDPNSFTTACKKPIEKWSLGHSEKENVDIRPDTDSQSVGLFRIYMYPKFSSYERKVTGFLQVIAGVGGFTGVMTKIFSFFGTYFSAKFANQSFISSFYLTKKSKNRTVY